MTTNEEQILKLQYVTCLLSVEVAARTLALSSKKSKAYQKSLKSIIEAGEQLQYIGGKWFEKYKGKKPIIPGLYQGLC